MKNDFWAINLFELQKYKNLACTHDVVEMANSFINYIKEVFPVNKVPERISGRLEVLEERIDILVKSYELTVEEVCLIIQDMNEKGELK